VTRDEGLTGVGIDLGVGESTTAWAIREPDGTWNVSTKGPLPDAVTGIRTSWGRTVTFDRAKPIPAEAYIVAGELWHVCMPGYKHPDEESPDAALYLVEALCLVEHDDDLAFGSDRVTRDVRAYLEGAGTVRCGIESHHRGSL
jgi:hypothetical protein